MEKDARARKLPKARRYDVTCPSALIVADIMSFPVISIPEGSSALVAVETMRRHGHEHLVVMDEDGGVAGVLSDRDLRAAQPSLLLVKDEVMRTKALGVIRVSDLMARYPHAALPEEEVSSVLRRMLDRRIGCVPVVDRSGQLEGIITGGDIAKLALALIEG